MWPFTLLKLWPRKAENPRTFNDEHRKILNTTEKLEEENWDFYDPDVFYPAQIGQVFNSRYQILGKLGYGGHSTAERRYVTLKICEQESSSAVRELAAYNHVNTISSTHEGVSRVRKLLDSFNIQAAHGSHHCLIHEPLGISLATFRDVISLPEPLFKEVLKYLLKTLDFLHTEAGIVHTDLQARNLHLGIRDQSILRAFEENELADPSPRKRVGDHFIYDSRGLKFDRSPGPPVLCDFGEARLGQGPHRGLIQPAAYRAPEPMLNMPWDHKVDIWNLGVMAWHLFRDQLLFGVPSPECRGRKWAIAKLTAMVDTLGLPSEDFIQRCGEAQNFFGDYIAANGRPENCWEDAHPGGEGTFECFVGKMVRWMPEERPTAKELLGDGWLNG